MMVDDDFQRRNHQQIKCMLFSSVPEHSHFIMQFYQITGEQRTWLFKKA